jgi:hypothetical protein
MNNDDDGISPAQKREEKARVDLLKNSVRDMNILYESLGKQGRAMQIRPEEEYFIFSAKPEKNNEREEDAQSTNDG